MSERRDYVKTTVRLVVASLVVGLVLTLLGITPGDILGRIADLAVGLWDLITEAIGWAGGYIVVGALVVIPLWLLGLLWKRLRGQER